VNPDRTKGNTVWLWSGKGRGDTGASQNSQKSSGGIQSRSDEIKNRKQDSKRRERQCDSSVGGRRDSNIRIFKDRDDEIVLDVDPMDVTSMNLGAPKTGVKSNSREDAKNINSVKRGRVGQDGTPSNFQQEGSSSSGESKGKRKGPKH